MGYRLLNANKEDYLEIITAYIPRMEEWEDPYQVNQVRTIILRYGIKL